MVAPITKQDWEKWLARDPYWKGRWPYISEAIRMAESQSPKSVLELGGRDHAIYRGSVSMDYRGYGRFRPKIRHDATKTPWPVEDKSFDLFIALQVWEHLGSAQSEAFDEVARVSRAAVLSFPLEWETHSFNDCHRGITRRQIVESWARRPPTDEVVVSKPYPPRKRIVMLWEFK